MILRAVGLSFLALCFVAAGVWFSEKGKKTYRDLETLCLLIDHLRNEIAYSRTELSSCFSSFFSVHAHPSSESFFKNDFEDALRAFDLPADLREEVGFFFAKLGSSAAEEEVRRCEKLLDKLEKRFEKAKAEAPGRTKTALTLGICAGAVLLLLFL